MHARWIAASLIVAFALPAHGQSAAVLGKNDIEFASKLRQRGNTDLAEALVATIEKSDKISPEARIGVRALHLDLRLDIALRETDPIKRKDLLRAILEEKEGLITEFQGRLEVQDTVESMPDVYQRMGEAIGAAIKAEQNPDAIGLLQKEGADVYRQADTKLMARIEQLKQRIDNDGEAATQADLNEYINARFALPRTRYFHALLYPKGEFKRDELLGLAIKGFDDFCLDYSETANNYYSLIYIGLALKELGKTEEALSALNDVIKLREEFLVDAKGNYMMGQLEADLVSEAVLEKVQYLTELKRVDEAIAMAKSFIDTTIDGGFETTRGMAILMAKADAHLTAGDTKSAAAIADQLVKLDPRGYWGQRGREMQGRFLAGSASVDPEQALRIAQTYFDRGDDRNALDWARKSISVAGKDSKGLDLAIDAHMLMGAVYQRADMPHAAAQAFDAAVERFPAAAKAPEALYQSIRAYLTINEVEKRPYYKKRIDEKNKVLASRYASHPLAARATLTEGDQKAGDGDFLGAVESYGKVAPTSPAYLSAQFATGSAWLRHSRELIKQNKGAEAKTFVTQAETVLKKVMEDADKKAADTMDVQQKASLEDLALRTRTMLVQMYLFDDVNRPADVMTLLDGADDRFASNEQALNLLWGARIQALQKLGKLDDAVSLLDGLIKRSPESKAIAGAAGRVARALDAQAAELAKTPNKAREAAEATKRAAQYYAVSGRAMLKSENAKSSEIESIATRLFALGLELNAVPQDQDTFIGWDPKATKDASMWQLSVELYEAGLRLSPNWEAEIRLARVLGYLGEYQRAASVYGTLFDREPMYNRETRALNRNLIRGKPTMLNAFMEQGVAVHHVAVKNQEADDFRLAGEILNAMMAPGALTPNTRNWWWIKYYQLRNQASAGGYEEAKRTYRELERSTTGMGAEFGVKPALDAVWAEIKDK